MNYIQIGKIVNTHGLKGEVKVVASTDFKRERYSPKKPVYIYFNDNYIKCYVKSYREHKGADLLTFVGLDHINKVELYKGSDLYSEDTIINDLKKDEFHIKDILHLEVYQNNLLVGLVDDIREYPQCDYLVVKKIDGLNSLIPFRDEFVLNVDLDNHRIDIALIEGLL